MARSARGRGCGQAPRRQRRRSPGLVRRSGRRPGMFRRARAATVRGGAAGYYWKEPRLINVPALVSLFHITTETRRCASDTQSGPQKQVAAGWLDQASGDRGHWIVDTLPLSQRVWRSVASDGASDACDYGGGKYPVGSDEDIGDPLSRAGGCVGVAEPERLDGDEAGTNRCIQQSPENPARGALNPLSHICAGQTAGRHRKCRRGLGRARGRLPSVWSPQAQFVGLQPTQVHGYRRSCQTASRKVSCPAIRAPCKMTWPWAVKRRHTPYRRQRSGQWRRRPRRCRQSVAAQTERADDVRPVQADRSLDHASGEVKDALGAHPVSMGARQRPPPYRGARPFCRSPAPSSKAVTTAARTTRSAPQPAAFAVSSSSGLLSASRRGAPRECFPQRPFRLAQIIEVHGLIVLHRRSAKRPRQREGRHSLGAHGSHQIRPGEADDARGAHAEVRGSTRAPRLHHICSGLGVP